MTGVIDAISPQNTGLPTFTGTERDGQILSGQPGQLDRHTHDRIHLPVAALHLRQPRLMRGHRLRRDLDQLHPDARRRRQPRAATGDRHPRRERLRHNHRIVSTSAESSTRSRPRTPTLPTFTGTETGRPDPVGKPGHLDRHTHDRIHLPMAALHLRQPRLMLGHRSGGDLDRLHPDRRRRRQPRPPTGDRHPLRERLRHNHRIVDPERSHRRDPAGKHPADEHRAAIVHRHPAGRPGAVRKPGQLDRHTPDRIHLQVAALQPCLLEHRRGDLDQVHAQAPPTSAGGSGSS